VRKEQELKINNQNCAYVVKEFNKLSEQLDHVRACRGAIVSDFLLTNRRACTLAV
jgi:hypothetical protein